MLFSSFSYSWAEGPKDPYIVIINSYHYGHDWSQSEVDGLFEVLHPKYPKRLPSVEYLDTNRFGDENNLKRTASFLIAKYEGRNPDIVIALDNPALELLIANRSRLFAGVPIVFAGINDFKPSMLKGYDRITGIAEVVDNRGAIEIILKINPKTRRILILNDRTITGQALHRDLEPLLDIFRGKTEISFYYPESFADARRHIDSLPEGTAVLIASFVACGGQTMTTPESTQFITSGNRVPVYAMRESRLGHGIVGGSLLSGSEHGRRAGRIVIRILDGEYPSSIPVDTAAHSIPMFDYRVMERLGIPLDRLPSGSLVINRQQSFLELHKTPILYALGIILFLSLAIVLLSVNIMKRRKAEKKLLELSRYTSALFEEARDAIFVTDIATGIILDANRAAEKLMKRPKSELIGLHQSKLYPSDDGIAAFKQHIQGLGDMVALKILNSEGEKTPVEISSTVMEFPDGRRILKSVFRDVSERNRLQEQLLYAQKMEAVGILAGGVAHEFNNALTAIIGATELMMMELDRKSRLYHFADIILKSSNRASRLTHNLLLFCKKQVINPVCIDINELILQQEALFSQLRSEDMVIVKELSSSPCTVLADPGQLEQIIMNVVLNARDAMPNKGKLEIRTKLVKGAEVPADMSAKDSDYVLMSFRDNGSGIDDSIKDKIFEPFFTTKDVGKGTGLGLSIVYGIVMQNNGFIDVKSSAGKGTDFRIFLPFKTK
jgi:two-component system, cell cycle sensor histidine kinase and response regulator CckA